MYSKTAVILFGFLALARSQSTPVSTCLWNSGSPPINTYVEGCLSTPCQLPQLQDVVFSIIFEAPRTIRSMQTLANAYILGPFGIPYDLGEDAVTCNFLTNTYCPLLPTEVVTYSLRMFIESWMAAGTSVTIEFRIVDENDDPVMCLRIPITIVNALPAASTNDLEARNITVVVKSDGQ